MNIKKKVWLISLLLILITGCKQTYNWTGLQKAATNHQRIALGNYQDYWLDWSGDSTKIVGLAIEQKFGVHCLDLNKMTFDMVDGLFIPAQADVRSEPITWKAPIKTEPMNQTSPCWSKKGDFIGYVENNSSYTESEVHLMDLKTKKKQIISFKELGRVTGIDFAWTKLALAVYGEKGVLVYNIETQKTEITWSSLKPVELVRWFPKDESLLLIINNKGVRLDLGPKDLLVPRAFLKQKLDTCCFVPNKKELILSRGDEGLFGYNYETQKYRRITDGFDYQPRVSPNGKWVSFISESPLVGGFVVKLN